MREQFISKEPIKESTISAVIIRKDGTREDLGVVSYYNSNPFKRLWFNIKKLTKQIYRRFA